MRDAAIEQMARLEDTHWWFVGKRMLVDTVLASVAGGRVLDVGCGTGGLLAALRERWQPCGTDVSRSALEHSRRRGLDALVNAAAERLPFRPRSFALVSALDVLEHADDDRAVLAEIRAVLVDGGALVVSVPALPALWSTHDESLGHRRRYTRHTLQRALEDAGFSVEHMTYTNTAILPVAALVRGVGRWRRRRAAERIAMYALPRPLNALMIGVYRLEAAVARHLRLPLGVSLLCLARPRPASSA
jgi:ubiquinone/menaquinone biosynthesis C-methylase UbiE